jgi:hypothetical protein
MYNETQVSFIAPVTPAHSNYVAVQIVFADGFNLETLPKWVRAHPMMTIDCTPREGNQKNEQGVKRLRRILEGLRGTSVYEKKYSNTLPMEEWLERYA